MYIYTHMHTHTHPHTHTGFQVAQWSRIPLQSRRPMFESWVEKIPWSRTWQPTPVFFPGKSHGQRSLGGYGSTGLQNMT